MSIPTYFGQQRISDAQARLSTQAVHTANASAALARVEQLHQQLTTEIAALREHLTKAAGV